MKKKLGLLDLATALKLEVKPEPVHSIEWHDLTEVIQDNAEVRQGLKTYWNAIRYSPARLHPESPYARFVTKTCDNINLNSEMYCERCGNKHARYDTKKGWMPAYKRPEDTGAVGYNAVAKSINRFPRPQDPAVNARMTMRVDGQVVRREIQSIRKDAGADNKIAGSDHSSDGTDCPELYDNWDEEVNQPEPIVIQISAKDRAAIRADLMKKYPELYAD